MDDGEFNILLLGLRRATIDVELAPQRSFREADVKVLEDQYTAVATHERSMIQRELLHCFRRFTPESPAAQEQFESLMGDSLPLGVRVFQDPCPSSCGKPMVLSIAAN